MNILIIDTATPLEIVAVSAGKAVSDKSRRVDVSHSVTLFESIDAALKEAGIGLPEIDLIGVGTGPGSFTGIRIAVSTARMLSQILRVPVAGIKTHLIYAASACERMRDGDNILVAFDAKKGRVFGAVYKKGNDDLHPFELVQPGDYYLKDMLNRIAPEERVILIGDGCIKNYNEIKSLIRDHELLSEFITSGGIICRLAEKIYSENPADCADHNKIVPFYSRKPDAEIMRDLRNSKLQ